MYYVFKHTLCIYVLYIYKYFKCAHKYLKKNYYLHCIRDITIYSPCY